ncbi:MAG: Cof-type HAD-IIB family hydrolase [Lachnospiraceae bacterium]|nr:Cof-type HAD-IIB family hydrolase [Lachnospiraceae bacterium]
MIQNMKAVIFDMDGVLIDSEIVYLDYQYEQLRKKYPWLNRDSLFPLVGMSADQALVFFSKLLKKENQMQELQQELKDLNDGCKVYYPNILRKEVKQVLEALKSMEIKIALASSSNQENIITVLTQCKILSYFDYIVSGEQFTQSKPNPEIYQNTMKKLEVLPEQCMVIEDSTYGIEAGVQAGATVVAIKDTRFAFNQSKAHIFIDNLMEIPTLIACGGKQIKAAFFDIDGTLAEEKTHYIPESTKEALRLLKKRGMYVFLSTGRHTIEIQQENLISDLIFDGGIYLNGQLCEFHKKNIAKVTIPKRELIELKKFLLENHRSCIFLEENRIYTNLIDERLEKEQARIGTSIPELMDIDDLEERDILQAIPFINQDEEIDLMKKMPSCEIARWGENVTDLNCKSSGKDAGLLAICKELAIKPEETIAFGDAANDIRILHIAGIGVAMGNSAFEVKSEADYVTGTIREDGIFNALKMLRLL